MKNKIMYVSKEEIEKVKGNLKQDNETYIVEIKGKECLCLSEYLNFMSELLKFPIKAKGLDGYNDWMRDLSWLDKKQIIIIIDNFQVFLQKDISSKKAILEDFREIILPWWESEVVDYVVGGETKRMLLYLVDSNV